MNSLVGVLVQARIIAILFALLVANAESSESQQFQQPIPPAKQQPEKHEKRNRDSNYQKAHPINTPSDLNLPVSDELKATTDQTKSEPEKESPDTVEWTDIFIAIFSGLLVVVTVLLVVYTRRLWTSTRDLVRGAEDTARTELRAYVKMSHTEQGLHSVGSCPFVVDIEIKNVGKTPAEITDFVLDLRTYNSKEPLPRRFENEPLHTILVVGDFFYLNRGFMVGGAALSAGDVSGVTEGSKTLYLLGYVDYIDKFNVRHRTGYARQQREVGRGSDNLVFVTQRGYNYDRERKNGEGNDENPQS